MNVTIVLKDGTEARHVDRTGGVTLDLVKAFAKRAGHAEFGLGGEIFTVDDIKRIEITR